MKIRNCAGDLVDEKRGLIIDLDDDETIVCTNHIGGLRRIWFVRKESQQGLIDTLNKDPIGPMYSTPFER